MLPFMHSFQEQHQIFDRLQREIRDAKQNKSNRFFQAHTSHNAVESLPSSPESWVWIWDIHVPIRWSSQINMVHTFL